MKVKHEPIQPEKDGRYIFMEKKLRNSKRNENILNTIEIFLILCKFKTINFNVNAKEYIPIQLQKTTNAYLCKKVKKIDTK